MRRGALVAIGLVTAVLAPGVGAEPQASRVFDRTYSCEAGYIGGLYQLNMVSAFASAAGSSKLRASASVTHGIHETVAHMSSEGLSVHRGLCSVARGTVKLSTKGLRGGGVTPLGAEATCGTPRRVLLRVRALFVRPVTPQTARTFGFPQLTAQGDLERAAIAVGTRTGKPIAYLSVTGAEKARLFTLRSCKED